MLCPMIIRPATTADVPHLGRIAAVMGPSSQRDDFPRCMAEQAAGRRHVILALTAAGEAAGYVQLNFTPVYQPFRRLGLPEIQDLNVVPAQRRQGLGTLLVERCEAIARDGGHAAIGISVGLTPSFGQAQRLYVSRGYVPDGMGICHDDEPVRPGALLPIDDLLTLKLIKNLS